MPREKKLSDPCHVRFTAQDLERLDAAAEASGHNRTSFIRHAAVTRANQVLGTPVAHGTTGGPAHASGQA